ncbi:hypothetical protein EDB85DRAFT_2276317 [Lactarius pseudohatsudake]|nr:hypothetical protein EDB85DRAFT_2276317 [Lactarius pseudohatsudake]
MSQIPAITTSSSNFRTVFVAALRAYEKKTKTDLFIHSLATQLQSCNSSSDVLAVLHDKANEIFSPAKVISHSCVPRFSRKTLSGSQVSGRECTGHARPVTGACEVEGATEVERPLGLHAPGKA